MTKTIKRLTLHELKEKFEENHKEIVSALRDKSSPHYSGAAFYWNGYKEAVRELGLIKEGF